MLQSFLQIPMAVVPLSFRNLGDLFREVNESGSYFFADKLRQQPVLVGGRYLVSTDKNTVGGMVTHYVRCFEPVPEGEPLVAKTESAFNSRSEAIAFAEEMAALWSPRSEWPESAELVAHVDGDHQNYQPRRV